MSSLYLDRRDLSLKLEGRALAVYCGDERHGTVPLHLLERVVMRSAVHLDSSMLARLADAGISLVLFGGQFAAKVAVLAGPPHNDAARRIGQYRRYDDADWCRQWSNLLVRLKIRGQAQVLRRALAERPDLRKPLTDGLGHLEQARQRIVQMPQTPIETLRGIEGAAAAAYFKAFTQLFPPELDFTGRNRRPPRDPVNAVLSLGYTLLHAEAVRASYGAGLDPLIGFFHALSFGRESLAADLIEPLRPRLDAWAWQQFRTRNLAAEHFTRTGEACLLGKGGRERFYAAYEVQARPVRRLLRRWTNKLAGALARAGAEPRS